MTRAVVAAVLALAGAWAGLAAPAAAQAPDVDLSPGLELTVSRDVAKTGARDARLSGWIGHTVTDGYGGPRVVGGSVTLPRGLAFHSDAVPSCREGVVRPAVIDECPRRSFLGRAPSKGRVAAAVAVEDGFTDPDYLFFNGGPGRIWAQTTIYTPALVIEPVTLHLRRPAARRWSRRIEFTIPAILRILAGVPVRLRSFGLGLDGIEHAPGYLTFDRGCPRRRLPYRASLTFLQNDGTVTTATRAGRLRCKAARPT